MQSSCRALCFREDALEESKMAGTHPAQVQSQPPERLYNPTHSPLKGWRKQHLPSFSKDVNPDGAGKEEEQGHRDVQLRERDFPCREEALWVLLRDLNLKPTEIYFYFSGTDHFVFSIL